jgi:hypothetical protein
MRGIAPQQTADADDRIVFPRRVRAAEGISNAPGTRAISMSCLRVPVRINPSQALSKSRSVINELNRETTIANRFPDESSLPSKAGSASGTDSIFSLCFSLISVSPVVKDFDFRKFA